MYQEVGDAVVAGLGVGALYALIAMGYTLILAASGVFNFAQGSLVMGGALAMYGLWQVSHVPFIGVLAILAIGGAAVGAITHLVAVLPVTNRRGVRSLTEGTLVTTFGFGLVLNTIAGITFGYQVQPVNSYVTSQPIDVIGLQIPPIYLVMVGATLVAAIIMEVVLHRTRAGLVLRAVVDDAEGAGLAGIRLSRVVLVAFGLAGALAAVAGALLAPISFASIGIGTQLVLLGFAGMAIGGFGSFTGALIGGVLVGLTSTVVPIWLPAIYVNLIIYGGMTVMLILRPRGLFGSAGRFGAAALREV
jgi:branched-chain amino acid transport system permease protein